MTWKSTAFVSGAGLLATWLVNTPPAGAPSLAPTRPRAAEATAAAVPPVSSEVDPTLDIMREAERLQAHAAARAAYQAPARDPFRFGARSAPRARAASVPTAPAPAAVVPAEPALPPIGVRLSGVAADVIDGAEQRTAIFSSATGVLLAREGEQVDGLTVLSVEVDAAVLQRPGGETVRLTLAPR